MSGEIKIAINPAIHALAAALIGLAVHGLRDPVLKLVRLIGGEI
jgi:hypothetical protein